MTKNAPGRNDREGLTIIDLFKMFPDDEAAEKWFEDQRWPEGRKCCPDCGSMNYAVVANRRPMPYRCRDCRSYFSVKKGTVMQSSKIGLQKWLFAMYMMSTSLKGAASMKVYRELGITQKTAWTAEPRGSQALSRRVCPQPSPYERHREFLVVDEAGIQGHLPQDVSEAP